VTGVRPIVPSFSFGQIGQVNARRNDDKDIRSEYGMFMYNMYNLEKHFRVYVPHRNQMYSKRIFVPSSRYPSCWDLVRRMKNLNGEFEADKDDNLDGAEITKERVMSRIEPVVQVHDTKTVEKDYVKVMNEDIQRLKVDLRNNPGNTMHMFDDEIFRRNEIESVDNI